MSQKALAHIWKSFSTIVKKLRDNELFPYSLAFPIKKLIFGIIGYII